MSVETHHGVDFDVVGNDEAGRGKTYGISMMSNKQTDTDVRTSVSSHVMPVKPFQRGASISVDRRLCACIDDRGGEGGVGLDVIRERKRMGWMPSCITGLGTREKYER